MVRSPCSIADYDALFDPIRTTRAERSGKQPGDPRKAAQAILSLVASPRHQAPWRSAATPWAWCATSWRR